MSNNNTTQEMEEPSSELHALEQRWQKRIPNTSQGRESDVLLERPVQESLPVVSTDGNLIGPFGKASERIGRGKAELRGLLTPLTIRTNRRGEITVRPNTRFYWEDEETHIVAKDFWVDEDGRIYIRFRESETTVYPRSEWVFTTEDIARLIEEEQLRSDAEIDERARKLLEGY